MTHRLRKELGELRVKTLIREDLPEVEVDPVQIDQVLTNLLENAVRVSPPQGMITISAAQANTRVSIRVADEGPGIPVDERERVFEAFYRGPEAGSRGDTGRSGSGLGLAIAHAIVVAHGGRIWIEGGASSGSVRSRSNSSCPTRLPTRSGRSTGDQGPRRRRRTADPPRAAHEPGGARLRGRRPWGPARRASSATADEGPDLVFLDLGLPDLDGEEVIRRMRAFSEVPIIVLSVRDQQSDKVGALDAGADDYVTKPFAMEELLARLRAALRRNRPEEPARRPLHFDDAAGRPRSQAREAR